MISPETALSHFSGAVASPELWPDALQGVADACQAAMVTIVGDSKPGELSCSRASQAAIDDYLNAREVPDSRHGRVNPTMANGFRTDLDDFTPKEIANDAYYQDFLRHYDVRWHAAAALSQGPQPLVISLKRSPTQGPFERDEVQVLNQLLPHWRAAARQSMLLARSKLDAELATFARFHRGAIGLDERGRIVAMNDLVSFGDGLLSESRQLSASFSDDRRLLQAAVAAACRRDLPCAPAGPLVVRRPSGKRPYVVDVIALPAGDLSAPHRHRSVVLVNDLERLPCPRPAAMRKVFGLTPRETQLATRLCEGASLREAAATLQISEAHARQRLKELMAKTGTRRQSELLLLLGRLG